ncbi:SPOR domain-containing protein [Pedobacter heparinus]|uniref:Sporulation domain protein n=1 Tax=Pedobacter heparinus (strain ATCC 13125 / DSM 2366 / CIP 104194 / JCM 7457 / NBRC 12017 / NCIMB 9290 / NRRL B-14731 / HIM 762-3) TaxID=485917 RepID=C6Y3V9_PEDHD|nr:SPOR domain-containing protein [Pedobacter heparinus]ACU03388.1 Sporulation domain protein [Pedobacter heparinus DSM 2366]
MDILSYLTTLIKTHKEVGIPGLGTIYKRKSPGRYDTETHSFLPPSYTLAFTSDLKEQELLRGMISKKKNISADAATYFVEQFSQNVLDELSNQQESDFGDLGTFSTVSGSLSFIPKQGQNFGFDFYGLPVLKEAQVLGEEEPAVSLPAEELPLKEEAIQLEEEEFPVKAEQLELENNNADLSDGTEIIEDDALIDPLEGPAEPLIEETNNDEQPVYEEIAEVPNIPEPYKQAYEPQIETPEGINEAYQNQEKEQTIVFEPLEPVNTNYITEQLEEKKAMPLYLKVIIALLAVAVIAAIAYLAKPEIFTGTVVKNNPVQDTTALKVQDDRLKADSIARADSIRISNEKAIMAIDSVKDTIISYDIIAASLLNQKEADRFLADMKKRGIPAKVAKMRGKRVKISIASFLDEDSAKKELEILKKTTKIPGIYITPIRHTNNPK